MKKIALNENLPPEQATPPARSFNEMSILAPLLAIYTSTCLALMAADFWLREALEVHPAITPVYIALLGAYAADKEIRRWAGRPEPPRKGAVFVYLWALLFLVLFTIHTFKTNYKMPEEIGGIVLQVIGIFFGSKASKYIHQSRINKNSDATPDVKPIALEHREFVLAYLQANGRLNRRDFIQKFKVSERTATRILEGMADAGLIVRKGEGRGSHFVLPANPN